MLSVVLKILSILGILLLCVLGLAAALILLVLFFPVCYRISGKKDDEETAVSAGAWWLFGLLRVSYAYPEPGRVLVKVLPFTVYDSGRDAGGKGKKSAEDTGGKAEKENSGTKESRKETGKAAADGQTEGMSGNGRGKDKAADSGQTSEDTAEKSREQTEDQTPENTTEKSQTADRGEAPDARDAAESGQEPSDPLFFKKIGKIKYTIRSIYDKIKDIWENISCYVDLLGEEETRLLFSHAALRLGKILKSIRPRRIRGRILFGTGAPDTTGYAYGVYGMLSPFLGDRLLVAPDFTRAVLEGELYAAGHTTVFVVLWNVLKVLLDKKLKRFIAKMKAGRKR